MDPFRRATMYLSKPEKIEHYMLKEPEERTPEQILEISMWLRQASSLFKKLDRDRLTGVIKAVTLLHVKPDHVIVHQGEEGSCFYVVIKGSATVYAKKIQEKEGERVDPVVLRDVSLVRGVKDRARFGCDLCTLYTGRCIGELSVIKDQERSASVISDDPCTLMKFTKEIYEEYIEAEHVKELLVRSYFVADHPLFVKWLPSYRDLIAENLKLRHFNFGEEIFRAGSRLDKVYFVLKGQAKLVINPAADIGRDLTKLLEKRQNPLEEEEIPWNSKELEYLDPFKNLSVIERRKLRREEGYVAAEGRFRDMSVCVIGSPGILGDVEVTLGLKEYTTTAVCIQELVLYEMDQADFSQLILHKNAEMYEKMREAVYEKLEFRNNLCQGGVPIFKALLTYFAEAQPKDCRKQIIKAYNIKRRLQKPVGNDFFSLMSRGISKNRTRVSESHAQGRQVIRRLLGVEGTQSAQCAQVDSSDQPLLSLWRQTARNVVVRKKDTNETHAPKQYSADEYKVLKKKMQALGKSTLMGGR